MGLKGRDRGQVARVLVGQDRYRGAAGQRDDFRVGGPVRRGHQHLVARVKQRGKGLEDRVLAAIGHDHLAGADLVAGIAGRFRGDRLAQFR